MELDCGLACTDLCARPEIAMAVAAMKAFVNVQSCAIKINYALAIF
jgi:hypothetical protein